MSQYDEIKDRIDAMLTEKFYEFQVFATGQTKRGDWDCDSWRVIFTGPGKRRMETSYYTGLGLRKSKHPMPNLKNSHLSPREWKAQNEKPVPPRAGEVLHSLLLDGDAINQSFNDWCDNFGVDPDSMKQFKMYQECCETGAQLRKLFSHEFQSQLQELTQEL